MHLICRALLLALTVLCLPALAADRELLIYCGITMVRPISEIAQNFERMEAVKVIISQGASADLYQSARKSRLGDLYFPGEPTFRSKHIAEGLLGEVVTVGYNQMAIMAAKGNPRKVKGDPRDLLRDDISVIIGNATSGSVARKPRTSWTRSAFTTRSSRRPSILPPTLAASALR